jgi:hypothetical protein
MKRCLFFVLFCSLGILSYALPFGVTEADQSGEVNVKSECGASVQGSGTGSQYTVKKTVWYPGTNGGGTYTSVSIGCICAKDQADGKHYYTTPSGSYGKRVQQRPNSLCSATVTCEKITYHNCSSNVGGSSGSPSGSSAGWTINPDACIEDELKYVPCGENNCGTKTLKCVEDSIGLLSWQNLFDLDPDSDLYYTDPCQYLQVPMNNTVVDNNGPSSGDSGSTAGRVINWDII